MRTFLTTMLMAFTASMLPAATVTAPSYDVQGQYYETCACKVSCPCASNATLPHEGHCDAISLVHIEKGMIGPTSVGGLNVALVMRSPQGQKVLDAFQKGETDLLTLYLDDRATSEQRDALNKVLPALFGPIDQTKGFRPPQWVPMSLMVDGDVAKFQIDGGNKLAFEIENVRVGTTTKEGVARAGTSNRIELTNSAPFPWIHTITQGISKTFHYDDLGTKWDYQERNAFFGKVAAKGALAAASKS